MNIKDLFKEVPEEWVDESSGTNAIFYGDPHFVEKGPSSRIDNFEETEFNKVREIKSLADKYNVKLYINPGDMTDKPRLPNDYMTRLMDVWGFYDVEKARKKFNNGEITKDELTDVLLKQRPTISLVGNHDISFAKDERGSALRFLSENKFLNLVTETEPYLFKLNNGSTLAISGTPYWIGQITDDTDPAIFTPQHNLGDVKIHLNHNNVFSKEFVEGLHWVNSKDVVDITTADLTLNGHIHLNDDPTLSDDGKRIIYNPGALAQVAASPSELNREIRVLLIHINNDNTIDMRAIPLNTPLSKDIFDLSKKENKISVEKQLNQVKKIISKVEDVKETKAQAIIDKVASTNKVAQEVKELAVSKTDEVVDELVREVEIEEGIDYTIKEIKLTNFESHKNTSIALNEKGATLLIGESSQGKSSILRAMYWVLENRGDGKSFIRRDKDVSGASVELVRADGTSVTRVIETELNKKGTVKVIDNGWIIKYTDGTVTKTNTGGLEEVQRLFGMSYLALDKKDKVPLNFLKQGDSHFFLQETPAKRAKIIGALYGTQYILAAIKNLEGDRRKLEAKRKFISESVSDIKRKLSPLELANRKKTLIQNINLEFQILENNKAKFDTLKENWETYEKLDSGINLVKTFISSTERKFEGLDGKLKEISTLQNKEEIVTELSIEYESIIKLQETQNAVLSTEAEYLKLKEEYSNLIEVKNKFKVINNVAEEFLVVSGVINDSKTFIRKATKIKKQEKNLNVISEKVLEIKTITDALKKYDKVSKEFVDLESELKKIEVSISEIKTEIEEENNKELSRNRITLQGVVLYDINVGGKQRVENKKIEELNERLGKMSNLLVRAQTKLEDAEARKEAAVKKFEELGIDPENAKEEISKLEKEIESKYDEIETSLSDIEKAAEKMKG